MNHNHQFTGGYDFLLAGEPPYRQLVCCMVSVLFSALAHTILYSPWVIYFSIFTTQWLVRFLKIRRRSDLVLAIFFFSFAVLAFVGLVYRLLEVSA